MSKTIKSAKEQKVKTETEKPVAKPKVDVSAMSPKQRREYEVQVRLSKG